MAVISKEEQLGFLNGEIDRLEKGIEEDSLRIKTQYQQECVNGCIEVLNRYKVIRDGLLAQRCVSL